MPGVYHCAGGPGADRADFLGALDKWVADGQAPANLPATRADATLSRPLCVYPALPRYNGAGDPKLAESFTCR
jgi:feruloyl esterase